MKKLITLITLMLFACNSAFAQEQEGTSDKPWLIGVAGFESDIRAYIERNTDGNTLYIIGTGEKMKDYQQGAVEWFEKRTDFANIVISAGIKNIGHYAFEDVADAVFLHQLHDF